MQRRIGAAVVIALALAAIATGQSAIADLRGTVTDASGVPLAGVKVTLLTSPARTTITDTRGEFTFARVPVGTYTSRFEIAGFVTITMPVTVSAGGGRLAVEMRPAAVEEQIEV